MGSSRRKPYGYFIFAVGLSAKSSRAKIKHMQKSLSKEKEVFLKR